MKKNAVFSFAVLLMTGFSYCKKNGGDDRPKKAIVTTIAGTGEAGFLDATAAFAKFNSPNDIAVHSDGTCYITDLFNRRVRKLAANGLVVVFAGNGSFGNSNGSVTTASFKEITQIALDATGNAFILDGSNPVVRKISGGTDVSVFAGSGSYGFADGRADTARFRQSWGIAIDSKGTVYVADTHNERIRKIENGFVTTVAGIGSPGYLDGNASQAKFNKPRGIALDKQGNIFVCDDMNFRIRKITPAGTVSTYAGNGTQGFADGGSGAAQFFYLGDMVTDNKGNLYVTDAHRIRKIDTKGVVSTIAGSTDPGFADGEGILASFSYPSGLAIDAAGNIYVADVLNNRIRKINFE